MTEIPFYPINDFGPVMKGMTIGGLGIFHVFLAQFAIGGGMLMCYFQWLAQTGRCPKARIFLDSYFRFLLLVSFVTGALTGVGMWFTSVQVSPRTIGLMIDTFHWLWATEWTFFCLEVVAGYAFYKYAHRLNDRARLGLLLLYTFAAWMSLFWINGIISWQLTPGDWTPTSGVWAGFFNPSFWPSLFFRTVACMTIAALVAMAVVNTMKLSREDKTALINRAAHFLVPMVTMPLLGVWFLAVMPADSREWAMGGSVAMTLFLLVAVVASGVIGAYAIFALWHQKLYINGPTATVLAFLAFGATGGGEFVREGVRKPFTVRQYLYSNSIRPEEVALLREKGCTTLDPYPVRDAHLLPNDQIRLGAKTFRAACDVCHASGANNVADLTRYWSLEQKRMNIAKLQLTKPFMPPFPGNAEECEALVQFITWQQAGRPGTWPDTRLEPDYRRRHAQIATWLDEAGIEPASPAQREAAIQAHRQARRDRSRAPQASIAQPTRNAQETAIR